MNKNNKIVSSLGNTFWSVFLVIIKQTTVKFALKTILGSAMKTAGFKAWAIKFLAENFSEEILIPSANGLLVEGKFVAHIVQGKAHLAKLKGADNVKDHNNAVDNILS